MVEVAAWAGIHRRYQHKAGREVYAYLGARYAHLALFHGLAHYFQRRALEFRQLIQEQHTIVRQRYFSRLRYATATY